MTAIAVEPPFRQFPDIDGSPLESGYIYIGTDGLNPEVHPISVYFDETLTTPAAQPIRTVNGFASREGSPARLFVDATDYSITVRDRNSEFVYSALSAVTEFDFLVGFTLGVWEAGKICTVAADGSIDASAVTWSNLGTVTTAVFNGGQFNSADINNADIDGGTIDGAIIGGTTPAAGSFTTLSASGAQTLTGATTLGTSLALPTGSTVTAILDEDDMVSDSNTALATQQSIKAYVDNAVSGVPSSNQVVVTGTGDVGETTAARFALPIPATGTVTRVDAAYYAFASAGSSTVTVRTSADAAVSSLVVGIGTARDIESDLAPGNASVTAGDFFIVECSNTGVGGADGSVTVSLLITVT